METGVIVQWMVKVGDQVKEGDTLADIETDKATMPMKSYDEGTVVRLDHAAGDEVALGQRVLVLAEPGEDPKQVGAALSGGKGTSTAAPQATSGPPASKRTGDAARSRDAETPRDRDLAAGNGPQPPEGSDHAEPAGARPKSSPLARKMAESASLDLSQVQGSGPGGRIIRRDIEALLERKSQPAGPAVTAEAPAQVAAPRSSPAPASPTRPAATPVLRPRMPAGPLTAERVPHSRMRKTIAQRMLSAKQTVPEIHLTVEVRVDRLAAAREVLNQRLAPDGIKLSLGDFVTKAAATALRSHPALNASFEPDAIVRHAEINIGIAVALDDGLIVPVLRNADLLGLREIRLQTEALASSARAKSLTSEELSGGTFTISNLGMYGIRQFDAIINLPEVAILSVGVAEKRPVVQDDHLTVGTLMTLTITADHRAVDGATAAAFLRMLRGLLEEPAAMLL
jgi:pyruvate dehydrogenase E2 component (dihydrolipoamide acetyltransferase)